MSAPWTPVQSGPPTPVDILACLPAVTKFKRDNQLLGVTHSSSGLFTPLDGSSSSPSPSDTVTPEDRPGVGIETEMPVIDDDERHREGRTTSMVGSPATGSPEIKEVESSAIPAGLPKNGSREEVPRLSMPPAEILDHVEGTHTAVPTTRVFFQPVEPSDNVVDFDARSEANPDDGVRDDNVLPTVAADTPRKETQYQDGRGLDKPLVHPSWDTMKDLSEVTETDDPFKLTGNAVTNDDDVSSIRSSSPDEKTPR